MTRNVSNVFTDKVIIISGGASGIGKALGQLLAESGNNTVILADRDFAAAQTFCELLAPKHNNLFAYSLDVRDRAAFRQLAEQVQRRFGRIDVLFNNAGIAIGGPVFEYCAQDWDDIIDVNLKGVIHGIDAVYPLMRQQGFGQVVNTASILALCPSVLTIGYSASKAAVHALSTTLRVEAEQFGVKINVLCPGPVATPILCGGKFGRSGHGVSHESMQRFWAKMNPMSAEEFAKQALAGVAKNRAVTILPRRWLVTAWFARTIPAMWRNHSHKTMRNFMRSRARAQPASPSL